MAGRIFASVRRREYRVGLRDLVGGPPPPLGVELQLLGAAAVEADGERLRARHEELLALLVVLAAPLETVDARPHARARLGAFDNGLFAQPRRAACLVLAPRQA